MNSKSIIVTGVGGGVGQSLLKALQDSTYRVIAIIESIKFRYCDLLNTEMRFIFTR